MTDPRLALPPRRASGVGRVTGARQVAEIDESPSRRGHALRPYQLDAIRFLRGRKRALLGDEMGLGKTATLLRALPRRARAIVVCPASVVLVWEAEVAEWRSDLRVTSSEELRRPDEGEVIVVSYDSLPEIPRSTVSLLTEPMTDVYLLLDECHMTKSDDAQRTIKARMLGYQCGWVWGATGTPMLGTPPDLWGVLLSLGLAGVFGSLSHFVELCDGKERWRFDRRQGRKVRCGYEWGTVSPVVKETLKTVMLRRLRADVLPDLPREHVIDVPVEAPDDLRSYLDRVKEAWDDVGADDLPPFELLSEARAALARSKIPALIEHVGRASESFPLLVFSAHVDPILEVAGSFKNATKLMGGESKSDRKKAVEDFKAGKKRILAMTIKAGGAGLNLQEAGGMIFCDEEWTPGLNDQARARASRPGQRHARIAIWRLVSSHPVDVRLAEILDEKRRLQAEAIG
jgi:SWI/SNF-related matrix-associated actin-dependent regulator of chromatin subfamily A-like protein 1